MYWFGFVSHLSLFGALLKTVKSIHSCCLRGSHICECEKLWLYNITANCGEKVTAQQLADGIKITVGGNIEPGLYTLVAFSVDELTGMEAYQMAWMVFYQINIPDRSLRQGNPFQVTPQYTPQTGACGALFDHEVRMNIFLIKQTSVRRDYDLIADMETMSLLNVDAAQHKVEFSKFRDTNKYSGPPVRGNQYRLIKCDRTPELYHLRQIIESADKYNEIEAYLSNPNILTVKLSAFLNELLQNSTVTENQVDYEKMDCTTGNDFHIHQLRSSLIPSTNKCNFDGYKWTKALEVYYGTEKAKENILQHIYQWHELLLREKSILDALLAFSLKVSGGDHSGAEIESMHVVHPAYAKAYWQTFYRVNRIRAKMAVLDEAYTAYFMEDIKSSNWKTYN